MGQGTVRGWLLVVALILLSPVGGSQASAEDNPFGPLEEGCDPVDPSCDPSTPGTGLLPPTPRGDAGADGEERARAEAREAPGGLSIRERRRQRDASVDRNFYLPSAETLGQGRVSVNSYQLFFLGATYGITDSVQVSLTTLLPLIPQSPGLFALHVKGVVWSTDRDIFTVGGTLYGAAAPWSSWGLLTGGPALYYDRILGDDGGSRLSATVGSQTLLSPRTRSEWVNDQMTVLYLSAAFFTYLSERLQFGLEIVAPGWFNPEHDFGYEDDYVYRRRRLVEFALISAGLRFTGEAFSVDLALTRPVVPGDDSGWFALPFVSVSARF